MRCRPKAGEAPSVFEGPNGYSRKGSDAASQYYSETRETTHGTVDVDGKHYDVTGTSWMDKEFGSSMLASDQTGWDWFSLQLDDGRELMLYVLRHSDGSRAFASGTLVDSKGVATYFDDFTVTSDATWTKYPAHWRVHAAGIDLEITPLAANQENVSTLVPGLFYWGGRRPLERIADGAWLRRANRVCNDAQTRIGGTMKRLLPLFFVCACAAHPKKPAVSAMAEGESITIRGAIGDPDAVTALVRQSRYVFLGELHDNPRHHQLQADMLRAIIEAGRGPAVAFEMLDVDQMMAVKTATDPGAFGQVTEWEARGWPAYSMYEPIVSLAMARRLPIVPTNLTGKQLMDAVKKGEGPDGMGFHHSARCQDAVRDGGRYQRIALRSRERRDDGQHAAGARVAKCLHGTAHARGGDSWWHGAHRWRRARATRPRRAVLRGASTWRRP